MARSSALRESLMPTPPKPLIEILQSGQRVKVSFVGGSADGKVTFVNRRLMRVKILFDDGYDHEYSTKELEQGNLLRIIGSLDEFEDIEAVLRNAKLSRVLKAAEERAASVVGRAYRTYQALRALKLLRVLERSRLRKVAEEKAASVIGSASRTFLARQALKDLREGQGSLSNCEAKHVKLGEALAFSRKTRFLGHLTHFEKSTLSAALFNRAAELIDAGSKLAPCGKSMPLAALLCREEIAEVNCFELDSHMRLRHEEEVRQGLEADQNFISSLERLAQSTGASSRSLFAASSSAYNDHSEDSRESHPAQQSPISTEEHKRRLLSRLALKPVLAYLKELCRSDHGRALVQTNEAYERRFDEVAPPLVRQIAFLQNPHGTAEPFSMAIGHILHPALRINDDKRIRKISPAAFPSLQVIKSRRSGKVLRLLANGGWLKPPTGTKLVVHQSDNFGAGFGPERVEGTTLVQRTLDDSDIPGACRPLLSESPSQNRFVPLKLTGIEPYPSAFTSDVESRMYSSFFRARMTVAACNAVPREVDARPPPGDRRRKTGGAVPIMKQKTFTHVPGVPSSCKIVTIEPNTNGSVEAPIAVWKREKIVQHQQVWEPYSKSSTQDKLVMKVLSAAGEGIGLEAFDGAPAWHRNIQRRRAFMALFNRAVTKSNLTNKSTAKSTPLMKVVRTLRAAASSAEVMAVLEVALVKSDEVKTSIASLSRQQQHPTIPGVYEPNPKWIKAQGLTIGGSSIDDVINRSVGGQNSFLRSIICGYGCESDRHAGRVCGGGVETNEAALIYARRKHPNSAVELKTVGVTLSSTTTTVHHSPDGIIIVDDEATYLVMSVTPSADRLLLNVYLEEEKRKVRRLGPVQWPIFGQNVLSSGDWAGDTSVDSLPRLAPCLDSHHTQMQFGMAIVRDSFGSSVNSCLYSCNLPPGLGGSQVFEVPYIPVYATGLVDEADLFYRSCLPLAIVAFREGETQLEGYLSSRVGLTAQSNAISRREIPTSEDASAVTIDDDDTSPELIGVTMNTSTVDLNGNDASAHKALVIESDTLALSEEAQAAYTSPKLYSANGELHHRQAALGSTMSLFESVVRTIGSQCEPTVTSPGREDFLANIGNLNKTEYFAYGGLLPTLLRFFARKYYEASGDSRPIEDAAPDVEEFIQQAGVHIKVIRHLNELLKLLLDCSGLKSCEGAGGMFTASRFHRKNTVASFFLSHRDQYARLAIDTHLTEVTMPDEDLVLYIVAQFFNMGSQGMSFDTFIEDLHRHYHLDCPKDHLNKDVWIQKVTDASLLGQHGSGSLGDMGRKSPKDVSGHPPYGSINMNSPVVVNFTTELDRCFPFEFSDENFNDPECTWIDVHGGEHKLAELTDISGSPFPEVMLDVQQSGAAIGWLDIRSTVFGQSDSCPVEGDAGPGDVSAKKSEFGVTNSRSRPRLPNMNTSAEATATQAALELRQAKARHKEEIKEAYKGQMGLLRRVVVRYQFHPNRPTRQRNVGTSVLDTNVNKVNFDGVVEACYFFRKRHSTWCESIDMNFKKKTPTPPPSGEGVTMESALAQISRHQSSELLDKQALEAVKKKWVPAEPVRNGAPLFEKKHESVSSIMHEWLDWIQRNDQEPEPNRKKNAKQHNMCEGGGNNSWRKEDPNDSYELFELFSKAAPKHYDGGKGSQMEDFDQRLGRDCARQLQRRRQKRLEAQDSQMTKDSFWESGGAVPAAATAECHAQLQDIDGLAHKPPRAGHSAAMTTNGLSHQCSWKNEEGVQCELAFRFKKELTAHQKADDGKHTVFVCGKALTGGATNGKCGEIFYSKNEFELHKTSHQKKTDKLKKPAKKKKPPPPSHPPPPQAP